MKTVFVLLLLCTTAAARIGETFEEFCKHHQPDKPAVQAEYDMTRHVEDGRRVTVFWINGKSAQEKHEGISPSLVKRLLAENAPGQWAQQAAPSGDIIYSNGNLRARIQDGVLTIDNGQVTEWFNRQMAKDRAGGSRK